MNEEEDESQIQHSPVKIALGEIEGLAGILEDEIDEDNEDGEEEIDLQELESLEYGPNSVYSGMNNTPGFFNSGMTQNSNGSGYNFNQIPN